MSQTCLNRELGEKRLANAVIVRALRDVISYIKGDEDGTTTILIDTSEFRKTVRWLSNQSTDLYTFRYYADNATNSIDEYKYIVSKVEVFLRGIKIYIDDIA